MMTPPFVSYITFNRLGITQRNLSSILNSTDDFEMHILDNNSSDGTWEYVLSLNDPRIKSKLRFPANVGPIFGVNFNLAKRKTDQYFFTVDNDVYIKTTDWISRFIKVFETFPEVGLLGVQRGRPYPEYFPEVIPKFKEGVNYLQLQNGVVGMPMDFVPGCCQGLRPELIKETGYWSEENHYGDAELSARVNNYTSFKAGFVTDVEIEMPQFISCDQCTAKTWCKMDKVENTCFSLRNRTYKNEEFAKTYEWKPYATDKEMREGKRTAYCASIFDPKSMDGHMYYMGWAMENLKFYVDNAN